MTTDRTALRLLCEAATPGPWQWDTEQNLVSLGKSGEGKPSLVAYGEPTYEGNHCVCGDVDDLAFIAASRAAIPGLLDELDAKDRRITELEQECTELQAAVTRLHLDYGARIADLQLRLSIATELNVNDRKRIAELESMRDLHPFESRPCLLCVYDRGRFVRSCSMHAQIAERDQRIAELESALRTAIAGWRTNHLCEVDYSDEELARIDELQKLVSSEET